MDFGKETRYITYGERAGFVLAYTLFTAILFLILRPLGRLPANWTIVHIGGITLIITTVGIAVRRYLR